MPLQDHFCPPLSIRRHWHAFHNAWATYLAADLNQRLPAGYFAEANVQFGIEIDVAAFEEPTSGSPGIGVDSQGGGTIGGWTAPSPTLTVPISTLTDVVEVVVFSQEGGPTLAGAIELVSPANKDRPAHRDAFVFKCAAYVQQGIGLIVVDVVTDRRANLHAELLTRLRVGKAEFREIELYAAAYRPVKREEQTNLEIWLETLAVGKPLPTMPLWLRGGLSLPVELETTYDRTCREQRIV
jgi:hypothetical protein